ncbi:hypothetical protein [Mycoplana rhizolycopersici]|uniref:Uncharacterized protein n=1 Tax=Mycoplana rhizolycopersici TaxID=2746702 RepID=A0ABX2QE39_9HYPH|nr:hypothetical protein [Rhizobium rhizolycopersici]NVP55987.1 hypothetical protein [Rhizobium rhizolycopersici]
MIGSPAQRLSHAEDAGACVQMLRDIGRPYGRAIMQAVISDNLSLDQFNAGLEAATEDTRDFLESNGVCSADIAVSIDIVRRSIIAEGNSIVFMLHEEGARHQ